MMTPDANDCENLFSYGTLQHFEVQMATFGRRLIGQADTLSGYTLSVIAQRNGAQQHNLQFTGFDSDIVDGTVLRVTRAELACADTYEPAEYQRILVKLRSGLEAWVYLAL